MASSGMLRRVAHVRTDVSEELSASIIRVTRIGELGTNLVVTSNRLIRSLHTATKNLTAVLCFLVYNLVWGNAFFAEYFRGLPQVTVWLLTQSQSVPRLQRGTGIRCRKTTSKFNPEQDNR
jgi:hypothetical protein